MLGLGAVTCEETNYNDSKYKDTESPKHEPLPTRTWRLETVADTRRISLLSPASYVVHRDESRSMQEQRIRENPCEGCVTWQTPKCSQNSPSGKSVPESGFRTGRIHPHSE